MSQVALPRSLSMRPIAPTGLLFALGGCSAIVLASALANTAFQHWFIAPVLACGTLCGGKVIDDWRRGVDFFDPFSLNALLGMHLFFLAPLLHVATGYWMHYIEPPLDWRPWVGAMALLNVLGIGLYQLLCASWGQPSPAQRGEPAWRLDTARFYYLGAAALALCSLLQLGVYAKFGGLSGYIAAFSEGSDEFTGMGFVFLFSEAAPIVAAMIAVVWARQTGRRSMGMVVAILAGFILLKLAFGGLRGSRGHLIYGLFWAAAMIHVLVRPLPKQLFVWAVALLLPFMYAYGFYKSFGVDAVQAIDAEARADLLDAAPRGFEAVLLGDLARCDVQAFMLYRLSSESVTSRYDYAWGSTYLGTAALLVPRSVWGDRPPSKVKFGTDLLFGPGVFENDLASTYAYGLTGEAMLNFGPLGGVLSFSPIAVIAIVARRCYFTLAIDDCRWLVLPLFLSLAFLSLLWDSDVLLFYTVKEGALPCLLLLLCSRRGNSHSMAEASA